MTLEQREREKIGNIGGVCSLDGEEGEVCVLKRREKEEREIKGGEKKGKNTGSKRGDGGRKMNKNVADTFSLSLFLSFSVHSVVSLNENHNPSQLTAAAQGPQYHFLFFSWF